MEGHISVPRFKTENGFKTSSERSLLMKKIKSADTKPEKKLRKALWALGYRYRKNYQKLHGKPDIVLHKHKLVIFIDGEFWHGFKWEEKKEKIKANRAFWIPKIERNMQRDNENKHKLEAMGWTVLRFWEHEITKSFDACLNQIVQHIKTKP